jgi:glycosyltransferase involved in cell wall biosynthesis
VTAIRKPLRVLHLRDSPWIDGPGRTILETASHIDRTRIDYHVGAFVVEAGESHPLIEEMRRRGLPVHEVVDDGSSLREVAERVTTLIDKLSIDILHTSEFRSNAIGLICRKQRSIRLVSTAHGWIANDMRGKVKTFLDRVLLRRFDRVILVSQAMRRRLPRWWTPDSRVRILRNALVFERFGSDSRKAPRPMLDSARDITLLNVGRLSAEKGQRLLLRAIAALAPEYPRLRLVFAGTGPLESELRKLTVQLGVTDRVRLIGYITDMSNVYSHAELVVQSSFTEGLPNVILEAAYLGVPIVATDVGGTAEVIEHGVSGWLIRPRSLKQMVAGIRHFLEHPARFAAMTRAARARIEKEFSFEARTMAQVGIYEELAGAEA